MFKRSSTELHLEVHKLANPFSSTGKQLGIFIKTRFSLSNKHTVSLSIVIGEQFLIEQNHAG